MDNRPLFTDFNRSNPRYGFNRVGLPVLGRLTTSITVEMFDGWNEETARLRFKRCTTIVRSSKF